MLATPVLFFLLLEGILRLLHYGPDLSLFTTESLHGKTYQIMNPGVKDRYFYRVPFNPTTSPDYFLMPKPAGTFRIFCLGGSTTVGFPYYYNASFSSLLLQRLQTIFPEKPVEMINLGMTATNSFTALDMARDVMRYEPDLLIVYDGHNEFYGALGVASRESFGGSRWMANLSLRLIHWKTFLLLRDAVAAITGLFGSSPPPSPGIGMMEKLARGKTIPYDSDQYRAALDAFRGNLSDLRALAVEHRVPLIVATQASNLRDLKPFVSGIPAGWSPEEKNRFQTVINAGLDQLLRDQADSALAIFRRAVALNATHAETRYYVAKALVALGRMQEAREEFRLARDYDELRFRTSADFNDLIRGLDDGTLIGCADMEAAFRRESPDSIIGNSLVLEHLHPNVRGYFLMAREYAHVMRAHGLFASVAEWTVSDTVSESRLWSARPVTELDERIARRRTEVLTSTWPFTEAGPQGVAVVSPIPAGDTLGQIADQVTRARIYWHTAHWEAIRMYERRGDSKALEREFRTLIHQHPLLDVQPYLRLAEVLLNQGRIPEVRSLLERSLRLTPTILAYRALGDIALRSGDGESAIGYYEKMSPFPQSRDEKAENGLMLALAFRAAGKPDRALGKVMEVLSLKPDYRPAVDLLADLGKK